MELEPGTNIHPVLDVRPRIFEPPPVRLVAVEDMNELCAAGLEKPLDNFYVDLLKFERDQADPGLVYRAENFRLRFNVVERMGCRDDFRPIGIEVPSLPVIIAKLNEDEIEFTRQKGLTAGTETLLLRDPAGNWVELFEYKIVI